MLEPNEMTVERLRLKMSLFAEIKKLDAWVVQSPRGYWLCSESVPDALVRKLQPDEVDILLPYLEEEVRHAD